MGISFLFLFLAFKVTNTLVLPAWPGAYLAGARANQWAWHRKHVTTVTSVLKVLWTKCIPVIIQASNMSRITQSPYGGKRPVMWVWLSLWKNHHHFILKALEEVLSHLVLVEVELSDIIFKG